MTRTDAIVKIDEALDRLEESLRMLDHMGAIHGMSIRLRTKIDSLDNLRDDIMSNHLQQEDE